MKKSEDNMKKARTILSAAAALAGSVILTAPSSAFLTTYSGGSQNLVSNNGTWKVTFDLDHNDDIAKTSKMYFVVSLSDQAKYDEEKKSGNYITETEASEEEEAPAPTPFADYQGQIGISAEEWADYTFTSLDNSEASAANVGVKKADGGKYVLTVDVKAKNIKFTDYGTSVTLGEWGNSSPNYTLNVDGLYLYSDDGDVIVYYDSLGNPDYEHAALDLIAKEEKPAEETSAAAETAAEAAEAAADESAPAKEEAPAAEPAAAADNGSSAAQTSSGGTVTTSPANADFGSRDSTLLIVGIAAGVVIIGVIVALVMVMLKKKG